MGMQNRILVLAELQDGAIQGVTLEMLGKARELANGRQATVDVVVLGANVTEQARGLGAYGADTVWVAESPALADYDAQAYAIALMQVIGRVEPTLFLCAATSQGRDLSGLVAARLGVGVAADINQIKDLGHAWEVVRPIFGGNVLSTLQSTPERCLIATVSLRAFEKAAADAGRACAVEAVAVDAITTRTAIKVFAAEVASGRLNLGDAEVVVAGGRGVGSAEKFAIIDDLGRALGAAVGASRAVTDAGWRPTNEQIGQTGVTVKPKLYVAAGISGAVQHWVGMKDAGYVVAINTDPEAPIMKTADLALVGDLFKVIPELIREIEAARGASV